jgi:hypothetical protein
MEQINHNGLDALWRRRRGRYDQTFADNKKIRAMGDKACIQMIPNDPITRKMQQKKLNTEIVFNCPFEDCPRVNNLTIN